jgi:hypothetical protein
MKTSAALTLSIAFIWTSAATSRAAIVTFDLTNGTGQVPTNTTFTGDNTTTFLVADGGTIPDETQGTGLTATFDFGGGYNQVADLGISDNNGASQWVGGTGDIIDVTFNQDVLLQSIWFSSGVNGRRVGAQPILDQGGANVALAALQSPAVNNRDLYEVDWSTDASNAVLSAGQVLRLTYPGSPTLTGDIGFVGAISVETVAATAAAVPEPASFTLLALLGVALFGRGSRRRRR